MIEIPILETERLRLRAPCQDDFEAEAEFYASERSRFVGGPLSRDLAWRKLASVIGHWQLRGYGFWSIDEKSTGIFCGRVGLWYPEGWPEPEIGWSLMQNAEGKGIALEGALKARDHAYKTLGWKTAISLMDPANQRSEALAKRMGAVFDRKYEHPSFGITNIWRHLPPEDCT